MDENLMKDWLETIWLQQAENASPKKSLLVLDSFVGHLTPSVKDKCQEMNTVLSVIPGGLTSVLQPLDVNINKPFKDRLRENKERGWLLENMTEMVVKSFEKCGISNALDGSEDNLIIGEGDGEETDKGHLIITLEDINGNKENEDF
ncbi:5579_t:CDS:2 [Paraglomus occultum]|uniref:5579_t:CDS:1 n=1 Tax=Paraglomus occultum TaxID=144539 RepID=A0A9N9E0B2_9GLOM|nr:5579_t:CDS:2 [Paraglomus occultum]